MLSRFTHATDLSDGLYANVDCTTARQRAAAALEKRSLRQESDGRRRLVSYTPRRRRGVAPSLAGQ
ncbi:Membrane-fusion protein [Burkholderia pseudomallei]|nr:Membrane-fusion protein [Burkholderia pseudomallei]